MKNFNFELGEKIDQHFQIKFDGESDANSLETQKKIVRPPKWPLKYLQVKLFKYPQGK